MQGESLKKSFDENDMKTWYTEKVSWTINLTKQSNSKHFINALRDRPLFLSGGGGGGGGVTFSIKKIVCKL